MKAISMKFLCTLYLMNLYNFHGSFLYRSVWFIYKSPLLLFYYPYYYSLRLLITCPRCSSRHSTPLFPHFPAKPSYFPQKPPPIRGNPSKNPPLFYPKIIKNPTFYSPNPRKPLFPLKKPSKPLFFPIFHTFSSKIQDFRDI